MSGPNYCPECGHNLKQYKDGQKDSSDSRGRSGEELSREDYKEIFREEMAKAKEDDQKDETKSYEGKSGEEMTREEKEQKKEIDTSDIDPELKEALKTIMEADEETIEHMRDGLSKKAVLDVRDMAEGKTEDLRIL